MPGFVWIFAVIVGLYVVVKLVQGIRDFADWVVEARALAKLRRESREHRRQGHHAAPPPLKERPASGTRPPKIGP